MSRRPIKLNASQRRKKARVGELCELAFNRGITSHTLRPHMESPYLSKKRAQELSDAGMTAQLSYLLEALGERTLRKLLTETIGSELDGFVHGYSSDPAQVCEDVGRNNVNENGDVI